MSYAIADLHCDLLCYLEKDPVRTAYDAAVRCSIPQLRAGNVNWQVLAVFSESGTEALKSGMAQVGLYHQLPFKHPQHFVPFSFSSPDPSKIATLMAFENASTFCHEEELLEDGLTRLEGIIDQIARPVYISLTWNLENRFGGGAHTKLGLKDDGKQLLQFLHQQRIAIDLSHASDALAHDILNYIDQKRLDLPVIASHSNARSVLDVPRNLPDELAKEIIRRKGLIGLNLYRFFVGSPPDSYLVQHIKHWLEIGGGENIVFGADFFYGLDVPAALRHTQEQEIFFKDYPDASCYGRIVDLFRQELGLTCHQLEQLAHRNFLSFIQRSGLYILNNERRI